MYIIWLIFIINFIYLEFPSTKSEASLVPLNEYIDHFEPLHYDPLHLHNQHLRLKRSLDGGEGNEHIKLHFQALGKNFRLHLSPDTSTFTDTTFSMDGKAHEELDLSHLYTGYLEDESDTRVAGSVIDGVFSGFISTPEETYYLEKSHLYSKQKLPEHQRNHHTSHFTPPTSHSFIYSSRHVNPHPFREKRSLKDEDIVRQSHQRYNSHRSSHDGDDDDGDPSPGCGVGKEEGYDWMRKVQASAVYKEDSRHLNYNNYNNKNPNYKYSYEANAERMRRDLHNNNNNNNNNNKRYKRAANNNNNLLKRQCSLYLQTDFTLWDTYLKNHAQDEAKTKAELTALLATHVAGLNDIYQRTSFNYLNRGPYSNFSFVVHRIQINTSATCKNSIEGFCQPNLDATSFLNILSLSNHDDYCLAFVFSYRQFSRGTIGLAWVGSPVTSGGVCERWRQYMEMDTPLNRSLNTGIVTLTNYNSHVPTPVSIITFSHEIGHNFGAQHDSGPVCIPLLANPNDPKGNYLMFASATSGRQPNNVIFSPCSIGNITENLYSIFSGQPYKYNCFTESEDSFCGNKIVEINSKTNVSEECDCGFVDDCDDKCCNARPSAGDDSLACTRTANAKCSKSEGPCCNSDTCDFSSSNLCSLETECSNTSYCNGTQAQCPAASAKPDRTPCNKQTQVCFKGKCSKSICWKIGWSGCYTQAPANDGSFDIGVLCFLACLNPATNSCVSTGDKSAIAKATNIQLKNMLDSLGQIEKGIQLPPGAPCDNYRGYCDVFMKCRSVDEEGPLTQLKKLLLNQQTFSQIREWVTRYPWAVVLIGVAFIILMALFVKLFAVHTPSSNPKLKQARKITGNAKPQRRPEVSTISGSHQNAAYDPGNDNLPA